MNWKTAKLEIVATGCVSLPKERAYQYQASNNLAVIILPVKDKRVVIDAITGGSDGIPGVSFTLPDIDSNPAYENHQPESTEVVFPNFKGWEIFCCDTSKYAVKLSLVEKNTSSDDSTPEQDFSGSVLADKGYVFMCKEGKDDLWSFTGISGKIKFVVRVKPDGKKIEEEYKA